MFDLESHRWWVYAVRGVAAILFGIMALVWPGLTLAVLVLLFGAYALVDGITLLVALARGNTEARRHKWVTGIMGALGIAIAVVTILWPGITALTLLYLVAFWAIAMGALQIVLAIDFQGEIVPQFLLVLGGVFSLVFAGLLIAFPGTGLVSLVWLVGLWAELFGISSLVLAYRLRGFERELNKLSKAASAA